ncbi:MAG: hypothetical protein ACK5H1_02745 [Tenacibaculum sp.]
MRKQLLPLGLLLAMLYSCSSPLNKKYNKDTSKEDMKAIRSKLDSNELNLLIGTLIRLSFDEEKLSKMTYAEILENGKNWKAEQKKIEAEQKALAEKAAKEEKARIKRLHQAVMVSCFEKKFKETDFFEEYMIYKFAIQNKTDKNIRAIKGDLIFNDIFDEEISSIDFVYDKIVPAGQIVNWAAKAEYNFLLESDKKLKDKNLKDLKTV